MGTRDRAGSAVQTSVGSKGGERERERSFDLSLQIEASALPRLRESVEGITEKSRSSCSLMSAAAEAAKLNLAVLPTPNQTRMHVGCQISDVPNLRTVAQIALVKCPSLTAPPPLAPSLCGFVGETRQGEMVRGYTRFMIGISAKTSDGKDQTQRDLIRTLRIHARPSWSGLATACKGSSYRIALWSCQTHLLAMY